MIGLCARHNVDRPSGVRCSILECFRRAYNYPHTHHVGNLTVGRMRQSLTAGKIFLLVVLDRLPEERGVTRGHQLCFNMQILAEGRLACNIILLLPSSGDSLSLKRPRSFQFIIRERHNLCMPLEVTLLLCALNVFGKVNYFLLCKLLPLNCVLSLRLPSFLECFRPIFYVHFYIPCVLHSQFISSSLI